MVTNCKVGGQTITLIKTAADIHIDKSVLFDFDFSILQVHQVLHPFPTTTHYPPPPPPHRTHSPNLQLSLVP